MPQAIGKAVQKVVDQTKSENHMHQLGFIIRELVR
jgi:hypothetical protein